jgi:hypothetical protein
MVVLDPQCRADGAACLAEIGGVLPVRVLLLTAFADGESSIGSKAARMDWL